MSVTLPTAVSSFLAARLEALKEWQALLGTNRLPPNPDGTPPDGAPATNIGTPQDLQDPEKVTFDASSFKPTSNYEGLPPDIAGRPSTKEMKTGIVDLLKAQKDKGGLTWEEIGTYQAAMTVLEAWKRARVSTQQTRGQRLDHARDVILRAQERHNMFVASIGIVSGTRKLRPTAGA